MNTNNEQNQINSTEEISDAQEIKEEAEPSENRSEKSEYFFSDDHVKNESAPRFVGNNFGSVKKVSISTLIISLVFTVIITFMVTCLFVSNYKDKVFSESVEEINQKLDLINSSVLGVQITDAERLKLYEYLLELDTMFDAYEFDEYEYSVITDYILSAYASAVGDPYAEYYNEEAYLQMLASLKGENQGIGVSITYDADADAIYVINVMPNSPASNGGVLPGDLIVAVGIGDKAEYVSDIGYSEAITRLQGVKGTKAEFMVSRNGKETEFSIMRSEYENQSVTHHIYELDNTVGVIRITGFDGLTPGQFEEAMNDLYGKGIRKVVFDVRNNPGGSLDSIVKILDSILPEGPIIRIVNKDGTVVQQIDSDKNAKYTDVKFAVLANENTASAAELFTSALMDYDRAVTVGVKTFGKGSMQSTLNLTGDRGIKMTVYHYLPPYSEGYDGIGITPDVTVELADEIADKNIYLIGDKDDNQLKAAVDSIK